MLQCLQLKLLIVDHLTKESEAAVFKLVYLPNRPYYHILLYSYTMVLLENVKNYLVS